MKMNLEFPTIMGLSLMMDSFFTIYTQKKGLVKCSGDQKIHEIVDVGVYDDRDQALCLLIVIWFDGNGD